MDILIQQTAHSSKSYPTCFAANSGNIREFGEGQGKSEQSRKGQIYKGLLLKYLRNFERISWRAHLVRFALQIEIINDISNPITLFQH